MRQFNLLFTRGVSMGGSTILIEHSFIATIPNKDSTLHDVPISPYHIFHLENPRLVRFASLAMGIIMSLAASHDDGTLCKKQARLCRRYNKKAKVN